MSSKTSSISSSKPEEDADREKLIRDHERYITNFHAILDHASEVPILAPKKPNELTDTRMTIDYVTCAPDYVMNPFPTVSHQYFIRLIDEGRITNHMTFYMCILPDTKERRRAVWALYEIKSPDIEAKDAHDTTMYPGFNVPVDPKNFELHQHGSMIIQGHSSWRKKRLEPCVKTAFLAEPEATYKPQANNMAGKCSARQKQYKRHPIFVVEVEQSWYQSLLGNTASSRKRKQGVN